ncbi:MAG TPA: tRNA 2-thiouridine(34) synthase MnmA [Burkholderiales bacterium]|nr:tRNA 2-thiouridine(34) synthase MnmA [Burkholderiales bacterium]
MACEKAIVGMSGGVDSSVAAWLLKEQGFEVVGLFMKNWEDDDTDEYCTSRQDLIDAVSVADCIGIDIEAVNFSTEYRERVFQNFLAEYRAGRTPNPDVLCNAEIKFKAFLDHALNLGADWIATGHYARIRRLDDNPRGGAGCELLKAADAGKDQSYFLYRLNQAQLAKTLFPLGTWLKRDVRRLARELGLPNHAKRDSTGICFIGERPFREFLMRYLPTSPGPMQTLEGRLVGTHQGLMYYTIGQRQGLGIGGPGEPWYVVAKDLERNCLLVAQGHDHPALFRDRLLGASASWIAGSVPRAGQTYTAKTRYRQLDAPCALARVDSETCELRFDQPQRAITPGQSVVLYEGDVCLGGSIIC